MCCCGGLVLFLTLAPVAGMSPPGDLAARCTAALQLRAITDGRREGTRQCSASPPPAAGPVTSRRCLRRSSRMPTSRFSAPPAGSRSASVPSPGRARRAIVAVVVSGTLSLGVAGAALVGGASAAPSGGPSQTSTDKPARHDERGKNWQQPRQDAQPNDRAVVPAERGRRMTPQQRQARIRPSSPEAGPATTGRDTTPIVPAAIGDEQ